MSRLPKGFTEVEYLEADGNQYIDTGYSPGVKAGTFTFDIGVKNTNAQSGRGAIGSRSVDAGRNWVIASSVNEGITFQQFGYGNTYANINSNSSGKYQRLRSYLTDTDYVIDARMDGSVYSSSFTKQTFTNTANVYLFGINNKGSLFSSFPFVGKMYYAKMYQDGVLVRDFVPCLDASNVPCMWDMVEGNAYYNAGTGTFLYGHTITPVKYIESTGTQYIDTGVYLTSNHSVELDYQLTVASQSRKGLYGGLATSRHGALLSPSNQQLEAGYGAGNDYYQLGLPDTNRHIFKQAKNELYFDGVLRFTFDTVTFTQNYSAPLGNFNFTNYNPASAKYYASRWWYDETLVRDYIPVRDENNVGYLFDKVTHTLYANAGTGAFVVGPDIYINENNKLLRKKLALMLANLKKKRPYYCEVEYIESTEQQSNATDALNASWIDTGIVPDDTTKMECRMAFTTLVSENSTEALFGSTAPGTGNFRFAFGYASISPYTNFYVGLGGQNITTSLTRDTNVHTFKIDAINKTWAIDDTSGSFTSSGSLSGTSSIFLFARHNPYYGDNRANKPANAKTYYCKIWQGGRLVRDMIPVLDWNYTPCMYDKITGQLFYTKGTKQFSYGREIHYVDYLESTGTQWFDTGYNINTSTDEVVFNFQLISTTKYQWIMGEHDNGARFGIGVGDGTNLRNVAYGATTYKVNDTEMYNSIHYFVANSNGAYLNGTKVHGFESFVSTNTIYMFALDFNGSVSSDRASGKIWKYTQKRNGSLIRDFIPAIDENGVGFMFDRVSHKIYDNAGTGAFKYPARELDYIESSGIQYINTNVTNWNNTTEFETKLSIQQQTGTGNKSWFGCYDTWTNGSVLPAIGTFTNYRVMNNFNTGYQASSGTDIGIANGQVGIYKLSQDSLSWSEGSAVAFDRSREFTNATSCHLFCTYYNGAAREFASFKMYYFKFWLNGSLVRDYIPVFQDGVAGLLDKVNGVFYDNDGTGDFLLGKIVEPEYE